MKSIIVGTDFSKGSYVALSVAVDIANQLRTDIKLLWIRKEKQLISREQMEQTQHLAEQRLQELCDEHNTRMRNGKITWDIKTGRVAPAIAEEAKRLNAPMIVIGTNGASGFEKYLMGSTAVRILQEAPCPTLTIREGFEIKKALEHIVVPIRINTDSRQKVPPAAEMAKIFNSKIHILGLIESVHDAGRLKTYLKQVESFLDKEGISYTCVGRRYENYCETLLQYAQDVEGDLIVINTEQDKLLKRLFLGTNAQQIVHKAQIPVLCIHPEDVFSLAR